MRWIWGGYGVAMGWIWGGYEVDMGWIWGGYGADMGWIWGGYGMDMEWIWGGYEVDMGWMWRTNVDRAPLAQRKLLHVLVLGTAANQKRHANGSPKAHTQTLIFAVDLDGEFSGRRHDQHRGRCWLLLFLTPFAHEVKRRQNKDCYKKYFWMKEWNTLTDKNMIKSRQESRHYL